MKGGEVDENGESDKKVNLAKMEGLVTVCRGLANILVGWQKGPLGEWRF